MGKIILLNTPIGHLGDLTPRVREALEQGEYFAVEDTRVFKDLLGHLGIPLGIKKIFSLHDQSTGPQIEKLLSLASEQTLYVASEAGSPIISDPAYPLVSQGIQQGIEVDSFSGISSVTMALELSGLPPLPFQFHGFLPREKGRIQSIFASSGYGTHIFFEAPTRIEETLELLAASLPDVKVTLVRELSKKFQSVYRFQAKQWKEVKSQVNFKGEFILLFNQSNAQAETNHQVKLMADQILREGASPKLLAKLLNAITEQPTKEIYQLLQQGKKNSLP